MSSQISSTCTFSKLFVTTPQIEPGSKVWKLWNSQQSIHRLLCVILRTNILPTHTQVVRYTYVHTLLLTTNASVHVRSHSPSYDYDYLNECSERMDGLGFIKGMRDEEQGAAVAVQEQKMQLMIYEQESRRVSHSKFTFTPTTPTTQLRQQ